MADSKMRRDRRPDEGAAILSRQPTADDPVSRKLVKRNYSSLDLIGPDAAPRLVDARTRVLPYEPEEMLDRIFVGDSPEVLAKMPANSVTCAITSPPYWNLVDYAEVEQIGQHLYCEYRAQLIAIWEQVERVLKPNGKFCLNVPVMPLRKAVSNEHFGKQHTRMLLDLPGDLKADILKSTGLKYYSLYIWEKQTTEKMFGSYPYPPNLLERNYIEFIFVFVKAGKPEKKPKAVKETAKLSQDEWMELTKQIWWMYPANVPRKGGHPAPFPEALPNRLISMYTFPWTKDYPGDLVLDPLCGWGTTCVAAKRLGRRYMGIDLSPEFAIQAAKRLEKTAWDHVRPMVASPKPKEDPAP